jgi:hypothetical protein
MALSRLTFWRPIALASLLVALGLATSRAQNGASEAGSASPAAAANPAPASATAAAPAVSQKSDEAAQPEESVTEKLIDIKNELFAPLVPYGPEKLFKPATAPPSRPMLMPRVEDARSKLKKQRDLDWAFNDLNELESPPSLKSMAGIPDYTADGKDRNKMSPMERYLQNLEDKAAGGSNSMNNLMNLMMQAQQMPGSNGMIGMSLAMPSLSDPRLNELLRNGDATSAGTDDKTKAAPSVAADRNLDGLKEQRRHLDDFKRLMDPSLPVSTEGGPPDAFDNYNKLLNFGPASVPTPTPMGVSPGVTTYTPVFNSSPASAPAASDFHPAMNQISAATFTVPGARPNVALPQQTAPAKPFPLDPFQANLPKRAF